MDISGEHRLHAPRAIVWEAMLDPAALRASVPGCERMEPTGPESYDVTLKVGMAAIRGTYTGTVTVTDRRTEESYRMVVTGRGLPGSVAGEATMSFSDDGPDTLVRYTGDVRAQGAIARLGSRLLAGSARLLIGQFFKSMEAEVVKRVP